MNIETIQIFGDGKQMMLLFKRGKQEFAYIMKHPIIHRMDLTQGISFEPVKMNLSFIAAPENFIVESGKNLLINSSMFDKYTIRDLFKIINKKIKKR